MRVSRGWGALRLAAHAPLRFLATANHSETQTRRPDVAACDLATARSMATQRVVNVAMENHLQAQAEALLAQANAYSKELGHEEKMLAPKKAAESGAGFKKGGGAPRDATATARSAADKVRRIVARSQLRG